MSESNEGNIGEVAEEQREFFGTTKDGAKVFSHADSHLHAEGGMTLDLLAAALNTIDTQGERFIRKQIDFEHAIGKSNCVELRPDDDVVMAFRKGRSGPTPMVKNREPQPCNSMMVVLLKDESLTEDGNAYALITAFIGEAAPREPWDPGNKNKAECQECEDYWNSHALVYDESLIDLEKTEAFANMSEEERQIELLGAKTEYCGLFLDSESLYFQVPATLEHQIEYPHVTIGYRPGAEKLKLDQLGSGAKITAIGYGNNERVEGLLVRVEADDPVVQQACDNYEVPLHITLSHAEGALAKETGRLEFQELDEPIELTGTYGLFVQGKVVTDKTEAK